MGFLHTESERVGWEGNELKRKRENIPAGYRQDHIDPIL